MKHFLSKVKKCGRNFINGKAAFSLVELIVVIAIMAVMAAVLAPSLLGYVEKSRMQKDDSAMNEVSSALHLSLADQNVYDEVLQASEKDNYTCYCDGSIKTNNSVNKIEIKAPDYWMYNDNARQLDETIYKPAGKMRGVTITFKPNGSAEYILKNGIVNQMGDDTTSKGHYAGKTLADTKFEYLYNHLRSTIGDTLKVSSQTYRNSDYTIFIRVGSTGGSEAAMQDAIQVWGQFNGTNLTEVANSNSITGGPQNKNAYNHNASELHLTNAELESGNITPQVGDVYKDECYEYHYNQCWQPNAWRNTNINGWCVKVLDKTKTEYDPILESINGEPVVCMCYTFSQCKELEVSPIIPQSVISLSTTFGDCVKLATAPEIPNDVTFMGQAFQGCSSLAEPPILPEVAFNLSSAFRNCTNLRTAPVIPKSANMIHYMFDGCVNLTGAITIHSTPGYYDYCLRGTQITQILGDCVESRKAAILATK